MIEMPDISTLGSSGAVIIVVFLFLKYLVNQTDRIKQIADDFRSESNVRKQDLIRHLDRTSNIVDKNSEVLGKVTVVLEQTTTILRSIDKKVDSG